MWRLHQTRFHPDLNRSLYPERVGVVLSNPIRSYHFFMSILTIGLMVENYLTAKKNFPDEHDCLGYRDHRIRSYDIVTSATKRILSCFQIGEIVTNLLQYKHALLRCAAIYYDPWRFVDRIARDLIRLIREQIRVDTIICE